MRWAAGLLVWQGVFLTRNFFWGGLDDISIDNMNMCILVVHYIKYCVYKCKLSSRIPTAPQIWFELTGLLNSLGWRERWREQVEDVPELVTRMMWRIVNGNEGV
jgi:hypothetical protein